MAQRLQPGVQEGLAGAVRRKVGARDEGQVGASRHEGLHVAGLSGSAGAPPSRAARPMMLVSTISCATDASPAVRSYVFRP